MKRLLFLRTVLVELYNKVIYQKQSQFILHPTNAQRCPYEAVLFYSLIGRIFWGVKEIIALSSKNKIFKKSLTLDGFDAKVDYATLYLKGNDAYLYPKTPMLEVEKVVINDAFYEKISNSYFMAYASDTLAKGLTQEWSEVTKLYRELFFDNKKIIREQIENFRRNPEIYTKIFTNDFLYFSSEKSYTKNYMDAIDVVLEYHKQAGRMDKVFLASLCESRAGNFLSVNYRGKRLSKELIYHAVVSYDIVQNVPRPLGGEREIILDIGVGFGGIARQIHFYRENSTQILLDLPETLLLTSYYLKENFSHKKIALLEDIFPHLDRFNEVIKAYDFVLIPPFVLEYIEANSVHLVMNTTSLGFMSRAYLEHYLKETSRVLKVGGYFYSLNSTKNVDGGVGSYDWDYKQEYLTVAYNFDNRFAYPQWLGKKTNA